MRKVLGLVGATLLFAGPAFAADLAVKAPRALPLMPVYNWSGWYVGLNAGGGWGDDGISNTVTSNTCLVNAGATGCAAAVSVLNASVPGQFGTKPSGFIGGAQLGYNFQAGTFVWGVETDFQGADIKDAASAVSGPTKLPGFADVLSLAGTASQKLDWFGTLRGRLGFLATPQLLLYGTGGLAYGHVETDVAFVGHIQETNPFDGATGLSQSDTRVGWTIGGGLEWMFAPNWSVKGEYLYYDLGHVTLNQTLNLVSTAPNNFVSANIASDVHYKGNIARVGLNYKF
jgi:outer membrane immunogenic protein